MKIKPEYTVVYDEDDICIIRKLPDGSTEEVSPLSASAAMVWDGFDRGLTREAVIESVVNEFSGISRDIVEADLDTLCAQLIALGYAEAD